MQIETMNSNQFNKYIKSNKIYYSHLQTVAGILTILSTDKGIFQTSFDLIEISKNYQMKENIDSTKLLLVGTDFQIKVWETTLKIPKGQVSTYEQIAQAIGKPKSFRAVANALAQNKIAYFIPCHRILRKNGDLGGYKWGIEKKKSLLKTEQNYELYR